MDRALIVTWGAPFSGREKLALDYALEVYEFWTKQAADDKVTEPEMFFRPSGTGMWMVKGDSETLLALVESEESRKLISKGQLLLEDFAYEIAFTGPAADHYILDYTEAATELGFI